MAAQVILNKLFAYMYYNDPRQYSFEPKSSYKENSRILSKKSSIWLNLFKSTILLDHSCYQSIQAIIFSVWISVIIIIMSY